MAVPLAMKFRPILSAALASQESRHDLLRPTQASNGWLAGQRHMVTPSLSAILSPSTDGSPVRFKCS